VGTHAGFIPCMDPAEQSSGILNTLTNGVDISGKLGLCKEQPNYYKFDNRYKSIGTVIDEFALREDNGLNLIY